MYLRDEANSKDQPIELSDVRAAFQHLKYYVILTLLDHQEAGENGYRPLQLAAIKEDHWLIECVVSMLPQQQRLEALMMGTVKPLQIAAFNGSDGTVNTIMHLLTVEQRAEILSYEVVEDQIHKTAWCYAMEGTNKTTADRIQEFKQSALREMENTTRGT